MNKVMKGFIAAILIMGIIRFTLDAYGVPKDIVKYFSMWGVMTIALVYFAVVTETHLKRLRDAYFIVMPYMMIEVLALSYTWASGRQTIFHAREYNLGTSIGVHTIGHLIGGLTWEPVIIVFLPMELIWLIYMGGRAIVGKRKHANT